jgi:hypothetical protein
MSSTPETAMQISFQTLAQDSVLQIREALRRVVHVHETPPSPTRPGGFLGGLVELPRPDAVVWADTEIDVRRVVL